MRSQVYLCLTRILSYRAKYPLAIASALIDSFGPRIMTGYDIGCAFTSTLNKSPKLSDKVLAQSYTLCVDAFHGYAHNRLCQLRYHPLYKPGVGLEDFAGCERLFSETNRIAGCTRHASTFHRLQIFLRLISRWNDDKYAELSELTS